MKNIGKTTYLVVSGSILLLSIVLAIVFSTVGKGFFNFAPWDGANIGIYWVDKILVTIALIAVVALTAFGKSDLVASGFAWIFTIAIQLLPLLPRLLSAFVARPAGAGSPVNNWLWAISLIISLLVLIAYVTLVFVFAMLGKRHLKTQATTKAGEIEVVSSSNSYYAQEGEENKGKEGSLRGPRG